MGVHTDSHRNIQVDYVGVVHDVVGYRGRADRYRDGRAHAQFDEVELAGADGTDGGILDALIDDGLIADQTIPDRLLQSADEIACDLQYHIPFVEFRILHQVVTILNLSPAGHDIR